MFCSFFRIYDLSSQSMRKLYFFNVSNIYFSYHFLLRTIIYIYTSNKIFTYLYTTSIIIRNINEKQKLMYHLFSMKETWNAKSTISTTSPIKNSICNICNFYFLSISNSSVKYPKDDIYWDQLKIHTCVSENKSFRRLTKL